MPAPTYSFTVTNGGTTVISITGLNAQPVLTMGPPPRVAYTFNSGEGHVYFVKEGDDVCIKTE